VESPAFLRPHRAQAQTGSFREWPVSEALRPLRVLAMKRTYQPEPKWEDRRIRKKSKPRAYHRKPKPGRTPKALRAHLKRYTHVYSHHFAELNQRRMAQKAAKQMRKAVAA
jgi:hypothetical protein